MSSRRLLYLKYLKIGEDYDENLVCMSRHYFPKLKKACKMGVSGAKEVKFTTFAGRKNLIELKLIDGVPANKAAGMPFLFKKNTLNIFGNYVKNIQYTID